MAAEKDYLFDSDQYLEFKYKRATVEVETSPATAYKSAICRFMKLFFSQMIVKEVRENWRNFKEYFEIIKDFMQSSFEAAKFMIKQLGAIGKLLEFIMNNKGIYYNACPDKAKMGELNQDADLSEPYELLGYLFRCTVTK
jgi:hypothetical protein